MKKIALLLFAVSIIVSACGGSSNETKEINDFHDSIKNDTTIKSSVNAANAFFNDTTEIEITPK